MLRWLLGYLAQHKIYAAIIYLMMIVSALTASAVLPVSQLLLAGINGIPDPARFPALARGTTLGPPFAAQSPVYVVSTMALALLLLKLVSGLFSYISALASDILSARIGRDMRRDLFRRIIRMDDDFFHEHQVGELMTRFSQDLNSALGIYGTVFLGPAMSVFLLLSTAANVLVIEPRLGLMAIGTAPLFWYALGPMSRAIQKRVREVSKNFVAVNEDLQETLSAAREVKAHGAEEREDAEFQGTIDRQYEAQVAYSRYNLLANQTMKSLSEILPIVILVAGAFYIIYVRPGVGAGTLVSMFMAVPMLLAAMASLSSVKISYTNGMVYGQNVYNLIHEKPESEIIPGDKELVIPEHWDPSQPVLEFDRVCFTYPKTGYTVRDISFKVYAGQMVGIVGAGGAGKSTVLSILFKLKDYQSGSVKLYGQELKELSLASVRRAIGFMTQFPFFFQRSVMDNILYGTDARGPEAEERARQLCQMFDLEKVILSTPAGYRTVVTNRGANFSGSQQKRLALARALIKDPPLLLLDEPLTGLDPDQAREVVDKIAMLKGRKTIFMITHDLGRLQIADQILVFARVPAPEPAAAPLGAKREPAAAVASVRGAAQALGPGLEKKAPPAREQGIIAEQGSFQELCQRGEIFRRLLAAESQ
jgi:ABC-type multidrug transport system fused ATPase/permease subunit